MAKTANVEVILGDLPQVKTLIADLEIARARQELQIERLTDENERLRACAQELPWHIVANCRQGSEARVFANSRIVRDLLYGATDA